MASSEPRLRPWLVLKGIGVNRRNAELLHGIDFDLNAGEFHVLSGKQGGGKSMLCNILRGDVEPSAGKILVDGLTPPRYNRAAARGLGIESAGSLPFVFPHLTVADNIAISLCRFPNRYWFGKRSLVRKVDEWLTANGITGLPLDQQLEKTPLPEHLFIQTLSCLFNAPRLLILDETLENLPAPGREQIMSILRREMARGMSVLWATHQLEDGWRLADRISIIRHGRLLLTDHPDNIDRRSLLRLTYAQFPETEQDDRDRERFFNLVLYTEALLKDLPLAIVIADNQGTVQFINQAGRNLFPECQPLTADTSNLFDALKPGNAGLLKTVAEVINGGGRYAEHAVSFTGPDGELTVDYQVQAVRDGFVVIGAMLIVQDVSERERLRSRLILSHNVSSVGLLAAGVAHDVNNPLSVIGNYLSYLLRKLPEGDIRGAAEKIGEEAKSIQSIIDNLVAFSGHVRDDLDTVDLYALAVDLCTLLRFNAQTTGIELSVIPPPEGIPADIYADVKEMRQLLINLLRNAMEAQPGGGAVRVDFSRCTPQEIIIEVLDKGPGIKFERLADIFEPFVSTKSDDDRYHGIGLTIVYSLVEKYEGLIDVANILSGGCRFSLRFQPAQKEGGTQSV